MGVKIAFLNRNLDEEMFMDEPEGFKTEGKEHMLCKLKRSMYEFKQVSNSGILSLIIPSYLLVLKKTLLINAYT